MLVKGKAPKVLSAASLRLEPFVNIPVNASHQRPIIFLDVDGVLALPEDYRLPWSRPTTPDGIQYPYGLSRKPVQELNKLVARANALVVVSSTWRIGRSAPQLQSILNHQGVTAEIIDVTPNLRTERGHEIQWWLDESPRYQGQPFIILDDETDMAHLRAHLVRTDPYVGVMTPRTEVRGFSGH